MNYVSLILRNVAIATCVAPAIAVAPTITQCFVSDQTCTGSCGSSSDPVKHCEEPPLPSETGTFKVTSWQDVPQFCQTYPDSVAYDCDESIEPGWAPTGCNPGGGVCCKGDLDTAIPSYGSDIRIPLTVAGCLQPGGQG